MKVQSNLFQLFNPHQLSREELLRHFVVRIQDFDRIFRDIQTTDMLRPEQHLLIVGQRGMGKTTLLLRLKYAVEADSALQTWLIPLVFPEELYGVNDLGGLWETIALDLADKHPGFQGLYDQMKAIPFSDPGEYERHGFDLISEALRQSGKKLILLDNMAELFQKFGKRDSQRLREVLMTSSDLRIIGASSVVMEGFFDYKHPFYEFFKVIKLNGLTARDARNLLTMLGRLHGKEAEIQRIVEENPGRVEALRRLSGGVIRTMMLLFEIISNHESGQVLQDLDLILDRVTPLYKHRMDHLAAQQQQIVHAIAMNWDATSTKEIAAKTRLDSKLVSAQLQQLCSNGLVERLPTSTKNHLYQLSERFFNIWYLMRQRKSHDRLRLVWLTRVIEAWCDTKMLTAMASNHMEAIRNKQLAPDQAFLLTEALKANAPQELRYNLNLVTRELLQTSGSELADHLSLSDRELVEKADMLIKRGYHSEALTVLEAIQERDGKTEFLTGLSLVNAGRPAEAITHLIKVGPKEDNDAWLLAGDIYRIHLKDYTNAARAYKMAAENDRPQAWAILGEVYQKHLLDFEQAEQAYRESVREGNHRAWLNLGILFHLNLNDPEKARQSYLQAIEAKENKAWFFLAALYHGQDDYRKAEEAYLHAVQVGDYDGYPYLYLGHIYRWDYQDFQRAEQLYLTATKYGLATGWECLGDLYSDDLHDYPKAEHAYRQALAAGEKESLNALAWLWFKLANNKSEALSLIQQALEPDPQNPAICHTAACITAWNGQTEASWALARHFLFDDHSYEQFPMDIQLYLSLLIAMEQHALIHEYFCGEEGIRFFTKDRMKPLWFAFAAIHPEEYPDEMLRMGPELKETVDEILISFKSLKEKYSLS